MKMSVAVDPQVGEILKQVVSGLLLVGEDIGPPPQGTSLLSFHTTGNPLFGSDMVVTVSASPALVDWTGKLVARLGGKFVPPVGGENGR